MKMFDAKPQLTIPGDEWCLFGSDYRQRATSNSNHRYKFIKANWVDEVRLPLFSISDDDIFAFPEMCDLERVEKENPWLKEMHGSDPLRQLQASYSVLSIARKRKLSAPVRSTYGIKHDVEDVCGFYISEGGLLRAALLAGFNLKPIKATGSCRINLATNLLYFGLLDVLQSTSRLLCAEAYETGRKQVLSDPRLLS